jgi:hypothetical protein
MRLLRWICRESRLRLWANRPTVRVEDASRFILGTRLLDLFPSALAPSAQRCAVVWCICPR